MDICSFVWWEEGGWKDPGERMRVRWSESGTDMPVLPLRPFFNALLVVFPPRCAAFVPVIVAGLSEPPCQARGFGDICLFSESAVACLAAWTGGAGSEACLCRRRGAMLGGRGRTCQKCLLIKKESCLEGSPDCRFLLLCGLVFLLKASVWGGRCKMKQKL